CTAPLGAISIGGDHARTFPSLTRNARAWISPSSPSARVAGRIVISSFDPAPMRGAPVAGVTPRSVLSPPSTLIAYSGIGASDEGRSEKTTAAAAAIDAAASAPVIHPPFL